ncbi:MAG: hypothetical protein ACXWHB_16505 [Usitatibacter sp.]
MSAIHPDTLRPRSPHRWSWTLGALLAAALAAIFFRLLLAFLSLD